MNQESLNDFKDWILKNFNIRVLTNPKLKANKQFMILDATETDEKLVLDYISKHKLVIRANLMPPYQGRQSIMVSNVTLDFSDWG